MPDWVELKPGEVVEIITNLSNQGHTASEIGVILRDQYGVPSVKAITKKRIAQVLKEQGIKQEMPEDLMNLIKTSVKLQRHLQENRKDQTARRGYQLAVSKIRRLAKYYIKAKKLPANWRYSPETAQLLVK